MRGIPPRGPPSGSAGGRRCGSAQPWRPRECAEQRLAPPQGRPQRGAGEEGRAVSCVRAGTWLPALRTSSRLPPPQSPGGRSALRLLVGVKKCRCRDFRNVVGDSDFQRSLFPSCPSGIALYPGQAQLLSCKHHYEVIPPLRSPGQPGDMDCTTQRINYTDPFSNQTLVTCVWVWAPLPRASSPCPAASPTPRCRPRLC